MTNSFLIGSCLNMFSFLLVRRTSKNFKVDMNRSCFFSLIDLTDGSRCESCYFKGREEALFSNNFCRATVRVLSRMAAFDSSTRFFLLPLKYSFIASLLKSFIIIHRCCRHLLSRTCLSFPMVLSFG